MCDRYSRYLRLLGVDSQPSGLDGLRTLVRSHLLRVPFENISKLLLFSREGAGRPIALTEFLDGLEHHDFGGTCYSSNPFLAELLAALAYDATLFGADMSRPNVHTSIRVRLEGHDYHVDAGYAAPFFDPIDLGLLPYEVTCGRDRYLFTAAGCGHEMTVFTDGVRRHGYVVHPPARGASFFHPVILDSFAPGRTFMRCLRITRFLEQGAVELRNCRLTRVQGATVTERTLRSMTELRRAVDEEFLMPRCRIEDAVATLEQLNGRDFFGPGWDSSD